MPDASTFWRRYSIASVVSVPQMRNLKLITRKREASKLTALCKITGQYLSSGKVVKDKKRWRNCPRLEEAKEVRQRNAM